MRVVHRLQAGDIFIPLSYHGRPWKDGSDLETI
jgi:hypothetical protein